MKQYKLFSPVTVFSYLLKNRIVMAPMTRCRAIGNIPNELMAKYYAQRSGAGLIITEGTSPSPNGLGYARIPGIFNNQQAEGWKKVTSAVHNEKGKIFVQLMHTGRISHQLNMPAGAQIIAPSALKPAGQMWTDTEKLQDYPVPKEMSAYDLTGTKAEFVAAAVLAMEAGFDGVELHAANGYLLEQFLSPVTNIRNDYYGGNIVNRCRFVIEIAEAVSEAIGKDKTGIRLSPYGIVNDTQLYDKIDSTYEYIADKLNVLGLAYIHLVDHSSMGAPEVSPELMKQMRMIFKNTIILSGGYDRERAEADIRNGKGDLIAFGRNFISNPDLVDRMKKNWSLSPNTHEDLFYTADEKGYTDFQTF
jgi:N-ethylmaleimide reductase